MTVWTAYQGVPVESSDKVKCRHPKHIYDPDKMYVLKDASLLALEGDIWLVVCDLCGYNGITGRDPYVKPDGEYPSIVKQTDSLLAHINGMHHPSRGDRVSNRYTNEQIKVAIKIWLKWRSTGIANWTTSACAELQSLGFKPYSSPAWNPSQLGSLVRSYIRRPEFKNVKAGPMDEDDKAALAEMVREAQAREGRGGTHLADNVRITQTGHKAQQRSEHKSVDFAEIIAAKVQQEEETVPSPTPNPTLNYTGKSGGDALAIKTLAVSTSPRSAPKALAIPRPAPPPQRVVVPAEVEDGFRLVSALDDGTIVFTYKGRLMGGKPIKAFEV